MSGFLFFLLCLSGLPNFLQQQPSEDSLHSKSEKNGKSGKSGKNGKNGKNGKTSSSQSIIAITTAKSTTAHEITVDARDKAYKVY